jgi:hypothetical protein
MPLTKSFGKLVHEHAAADLAFAEALKREAAGPDCNSRLVRMPIAPH